ncbi:MAG: recombination factor protein RarA, putative ATPase [Candidatus Parcubacteria bacterium]|jgi:putative ATPase
MDAPLAEILRPRSLDEVIGQQHLIGKGKPIRRMLESGNVTSMILWGPPGCGKTTLAKLIAKYVEANFIQFSAVVNGIADVRKVIEQANEAGSLFKKKTIIFIDEIHRFNRAQQDAFLPHVENGTITLIGATTENPGFEVNAPLISRSQVYMLQPLSLDEMITIVRKAADHFSGHIFAKEAIEFIASRSNGDARSAINAVELASTFGKKISIKQAEEALQKKAIYYDKKGDFHYDTISAFIKSMRGNKPDATLHYLARMIKAGEDPVFIARRMVIFASEDVGNAQPTALVLATATMQAVHMIGMPEATLILAQAATYLATCKKSIASTNGISEAMHDVENMPINPIPLHLRNAANKVMKQQGFGKDHVRYPWLEEQQTGQKVEQEYMPANLKGKKYYRPDSS